MAAKLHLSGRRIQIIGVTGAGKVCALMIEQNLQRADYMSLMLYLEQSTFARQLGKELSIPVCDLDPLFHGSKAGGIDLSPEEAQRTVQTLVAENDEWIIDGKYVCSILFLND